jgi:hypothetical protein
MLISKRLSVRFCSVDTVGNAVRKALTVIRCTPIAAAFVVDTLICLA